MKACHVWQHGLEGRSVLRGISWTGKTPTLWVLLRVESKQGGSQLGGGMVGKMGKEDKNCKKYCDFNTETWSKKIKSNANKIIFLSVVLLRKGSSFYPNLKCKCTHMYNSHVQHRHTHVHCFYENLSQYSLPFEQSLLSAISNNWAYRLCTPSTNIGITNSCLYLLSTSIQCFVKNLKIENSQS